MSTQTKITLAIVAAALAGFLIGQRTPTHSSAAECATQTSHEAAARACFLMYGVVVP